MLQILKKYRFKDIYYRKPFMPNPRKLLFPFSIIYDAITTLRNKFYDIGILHSQAFDLPVICVGNLSVGGTGKSPMIEYLLQLLKDEYKVATLSRGYKRESEGFHLVRTTDLAKTVGDEPLQFKNKFRDAIVAVDANRREGVEKLLGFSPDVVLLDDAYQHRKVKPNFNILLSNFNAMYVNDLLLPAGNLRESGRGVNRADVIIITKCPVNISTEEMIEIEKKLRLLPQQQLYFTRISYSEKIHSKLEKVFLKNVYASEFTLVTGIAKPKLFVAYLNSEGFHFKKHLKFPDHHNFTKEEINTLKQQGKILTTEKDFMRLKDSIPQENLFYLPIKTEFINNGEAFNKDIKDFINKK